MTTSDQDPLHNHRRQRALVTGLSLLCLVLAIAPRQERALFITDAVGLKAFVATVPPIDYASLARLPSLVDLVNNVGPRGFFARTPRRPSGVPGSPSPDDVTTSAAPFTPTDQPLGTGTGLALQDAAFPAFPDTPGGGFPFLPASLSPPASSPGAPIDVTPLPAANPTPTPGGTPPPTTPVAIQTPTTPVVTPTTPDVTPAVPEPGTWSLMIFGFLTAGCMLRRVRSRGRPAPDARAA